MWGFLLVSILTILTYPLALLGNWQLTCAGRVLQGMAQGFIFPGCHVLLSKWAPVAERAKLSAIVYSGNYENLFLKNSLTFSTPELLQLPNWEMW